MRPFYKIILTLAAAFLSLDLLTGCSANPATGEKQFAAFMSPQQEIQVGAQEHSNILREFGGTVKDRALQDYVSSVGARLAAHTERADVRYQFFVLDTPVVNAFALPGGYVYITRGILAIAGSEAQLAAVMAHEIGHVTARHSAERYSHGVATSLLTAVLSAALKSDTASQLAGMGSNLYLSSYSRKQESQADDLGIRYLHRAGYDTRAMAEFLNGLAIYTAFQARETGKAGDPSASYFSTHPQTAERAAQALAVSAAYPANQAETGIDTYMRRIDGMIYGDDADQGLIRGTTFWHPGMDFTFTVPAGYVLANTPSEVVAKDNASGSIILFDSAPRSRNIDVAAYLAQDWMKGEPISDLETIDINGKRAATAAFQGQANGRPVTVRLVAVEWNAGSYFRFMMAITPESSPSVIEGLKKTTYSLRPLTRAEKNDIRPHKIKVITAKSGDTAVSLSSSLPYAELKEQRFRAINTMAQNDPVTAGRAYKIITE